MGGIDPALCDENTGALDANHRLLNTLVEPKRSQSAHEPANHNRYGYIFSVDGRSYTGWESPRKDELEIGKQVVVYYDPNDPAKNALTDFGELSIEKFGPIPTLMFGIGGVALVIFWTKRRMLATTKLSHGQSAASPNVETGQLSD